jgi:hypothetical protein
MADRGQRGLVVAAAAAALLALPAAASAELTPWLVGAHYEGTTPATVTVEAPPLPVAIHYRGRIARRGTVTLTLTRGEQTLQRRTVRVGRRGVVKVTFRVQRSALAGATRLAVVLPSGARARVRVPAEGSERLGSRGLDVSPQGPLVLGP